jgi:NCAIR mutase (PurE)-related protein
MKAEFDVLTAAVKRLEADDQAKAATIAAQETEIASLKAQLAAAVAAGSDLPVQAITDLTAEVNAIVPPPAA